MGKMLERDFEAVTAGYVFFCAIMAEIFFQTVVLMLPIGEKAQLWACVVGNQAVFLGTVLVFCVSSNVSYQKMVGLKTPLSVAKVIMLIGVSVLSIMAFSPLANTFRQLLSRIGYTYTPDYPVNFTGSAGMFIVSLLTISVLPAVGEESLLRGGVLGGLKQKGYISAIIASALLFALMHGNATQMVHQFLLGIVLAYVCIVSRTLWAPFTVHLMNNAIALVMELYDTRVGLSEEVLFYMGENPAGLSWEGVVIIYIVCAASFVALFALLRLYTKKCIADTEKRTGIRYSDYCMDSEIGGREKKSKKINAVLGYLDKAGLPNEGEAPHMGMWRVGEKKGWVLSFAIVIMIVLLNFTEVVF